MYGAAIAGSRFIIADAVISDFPFYTYLFLVICYLKFSLLRYYDG